MGKLISVFNNKGGVGKSTICWNLADALGAMDKKVLLKILIRSVIYPLRYLVSKISLELCLHKMFLTEQLYALSCNDSCKIRAGKKCFCTQV